MALEKLVNFADRSGPSAGRKKLGCLSTTACPMDLFWVEHHWFVALRQCQARDEALRGSRSTNGGVDQDVGSRPSTHRSELLADDQLILRSCVKNKTCAERGGGPNVKDSSPTARTTSTERIFAILENNNNFFYKDPSHTTILKNI